MNVTYTHGNLYDFESVSGWSETEDGNTGSFATDGDVVTITVTVSAGNKVYYMANDDNLGLSSDAYPKIKWRMKTSDTNIKAKIVVEYSDASTDTMLAETSSTTWSVDTATFTASKTIDHIRLYANQATGTVSYDFILIYAGAFDFPSNQPEYLEFHPCPPRDAVLDVPGRSGDVTQGLGTKSGYVIMHCDLDVGDWTRASDTCNGDLFIDIAHNRKSEPWQWLLIQYYSFKATLEDPVFIFNGKKWVVRLTWREYRLGSADSEVYYDRYEIA